MEAELAFEALCFLKRFRCGGRGFWQWVVYHPQSPVLLNFMWMWVLGILTEESTRQPVGLCL